MTTPINSPVPRAEHTSVHNMLEKPFFGTNINRSEKKVLGVILQWSITGLRTMYDQLKNMDTREIELPETVFIRDIDTRVFQAIALQCLAKIEGIGLLEGNLFDSLLGREVERVKGIHVVQDQKQHLL